MATVKKTQEKENTDNLTEKELQKKTQDSIEKLLDSIKRLEEAVAKKDEIIENLKSINKQNETSNVKIIQMAMCNRSQYKLSNGLILTFERMYQAYPTTRENAMILINEFYETFTKGNLTLDNEHLYMLEEAGIDISKINYNYEKSMEKTGKMTTEELTKYYNSLTLGQKESFKNFIISKIKSGEPDFMPIENIRHLNKLSQGGYKYILNKLSEEENF